MQYIKKLIILKGVSSDHKGAVTIECCGQGTKCFVSVFDLPSCNGGEYFLALRTKTKVITTFSLGARGRINVKRDLAEIPSLDNLHCIVYSSNYHMPIMYGTSDRERMWAGNLMDGISRGEEHEEKSIAVKTVSAQNQSFSYSKPQKIEDYFLNIYPPNGGYSDGAVATVNFYEPIKAQSMSPSATKASALESENRESDSVPKEKEDAYKKEDVYKKEDTYNRTRLATTREQDTALAREVAISGSGIRKLNQSVTKSTDFRKEKVTKEAEEKVNKLSFYEQISGDINALFASNPPFEGLRYNLPQSRWVKVDFDESGRYYLVGLIGDPLMYIGYGVPSQYNDTPPSEFEGYCSWMPLDPSNPRGLGFWLMYQDALSGDSVANLP